MSPGKEFLLLFSVLFLPGLVSQTVGVDARAFDSAIYHLQILAVSLPQIALVIALAQLRRPGSAAALGWRKLRSTDVGSAALDYVAIVSCVAVIGGVASLIGATDAFGTPVAWSFSRYELIPLLIVSTLAIGYREEVFYRAYLFDRAAELGLEPTATIVGGALLFAIGHLYQGVAGFVVALVVGVVLGLLYIRQRSLHAIAIAHGAYNLTVLLLISG
ncbi:MAG: CPBP family intramembrane metalloprotease [Spirochaetaceae bacterium]|nr:MAG: CPBP family intramembrane metalloprotease [Spirochaetaceae bacterium]